MKRISILVAMGALAMTSSAVVSNSFAQGSDGVVNNETLSKRTAPVNRKDVGGHKYDFEYEPFIRQYGPYGNFPDFDNRTFNERVHSDPHSAQVGASGL
jgi:hypothetical protein